MAEDNSSAVTTPTDPMQISASDLLRDNSKPAKEVAPPEAEDQTEPDDESDEGEEGESDDDDGLEEEGAKGEEESEDDGIEEEGADDTPSRLKLDAELEKSLPPEIVQRFNQQAAGLEKVQTQLQGYADRWNNLVTWETKLGSPAEAPAALKQIAEYVAKAHGLDLAKVLGLSKAAPADTPAAATDDEFEFPADRKLFERAVAVAEERAEARIMEKLGVKPEDLKSLVNERQTRTQREAFDGYVEKVSDITIKRCEKFDSGWKVDRAMIAEALKNLPQLRDTPHKAVRMWFSDKRAEHIAGLSTRSAAKGPEALKGKGRVARKPPEDPMDLKASDIIAMMNS